MNTTGRAAEPMRSFVAVDVEMANGRPGSICQIGIVEVRDGTVTGSWGTLVNPLDRFDPDNVRVHGIRQCDVRYKPTFRTLSKRIEKKLGSRIVVSHGNNDRKAFKAAAERYGVDPVETRWVDSVKLAQQAWPERTGGRGHGLKALCDDFGIELRHHDALADATATATLVMMALDALGLTIGEAAQGKKPSSRARNAEQGERSQ